MTDSKRLRQIIAHHLPSVWDDAAHSQKGATWDDLPPMTHRTLNEAVHNTIARLIKTGDLHEAPGPGAEARKNEPR